MIIIDFTAEHFSNAGLEAIKRAYCDEWGMHPNDISICWPPVIFEAAIPHVPFDFVEGPQDCDGVTT